MPGNGTGEPAGWPGMEAGPTVGRWLGVPATLLPWCHGGEPWDSVAVPGEPCWGQIHFHQFFWIFGWIHLCGLQTISHTSDGHHYHVADGVPPPTLSPLPPRLPQLPICLPTQKWAATCLAAVGPPSFNQPWKPRASANCGPVARVPVFLGPRTEGNEMARDIRRPL